MRMQFRGHDQGFGILFGEDAGFATRSRTAIENVLARANREGQPIAKLHPEWRFDPPEKYEEN